MRTRSLSRRTTTHMPSQPEDQSVHPPLSRIFGIETIDLEALTEVIRHLLGCRKADNDPRKTDLLSMCGGGMNVMGNNLMEIGS